MYLPQALQDIRGTATLNDHLTHPLNRSIMIVSVFGSISAISLRGVNVKHRYHPRFDQMEENLATFTRKQIVTTIQERIARQQRSRSTVPKSIESKNELHRL